VQAFTPAVSGGPEGPHYIGSDFSRGLEGGHDVHIDKLTLNPGGYAKWVRIPHGPATVSGYAALWSSVPGP